MPSPPTSQTSQSLLEDLPFCLARSALSFRRFNDKTLRAVGLEQLAPGLASVLHAAEELGDCTVNSLVEATHLPNGTLTGLLDTLQRDGLVQRARNPQDRRSTIIQLTRDGHQLCDTLHLRHRKVMHVFRDSLSDADVTELTRLLEEATACMRQYTAEEDRPFETFREPKSPASEPR